MARDLIGACGLSLVIGLVCQPAEAGDRKSTGGLQESKRAVLVTHNADAGSIPGATIGTSANRPFALDYSVDHRPGSGKEGEAAARTHARKTLTLFRFNSNFGEVDVQPVIGHVNGAQLSIGF
jgi:hypothetical protein